MVDDAWSIFAKLLTQEMAKTSVSSRELARRLKAKDPKITEETVANWRRRRSRPTLEMLGPIVDALNVERRTPPGEDPFSLLGLLQQMKVIPDNADDADIFDRAYRLLKLQLKQQDAEDAFSELGRRAGAARVVQAAVTSTKWAVAVWPAYDGPDANHQMHIADRIDIRRMDPEDGNVDDAVWADPAMKAALRGTNAMPSQRDLRRWTESSPGEISKWSIPHVTSPREPLVSAHWAGLRGVALVATTRQSWVNEVASLVAIGLGYGLITTSQLAMTAIGLRPNNTKVGDQYKMHQRLLTNPPHRRVWSHWGMPPGMEGRPFGAYSKEEDSTPRFIFLDETDALLSETVSDRLTFEELDDARAELRRASDTFPPTHLLRLKTERFVSDRPARWLQVFEQAAQILRWLSGPGMGTFPPRTLRDIHRYASDRNPTVDRPVLDWLRTQGGWPTRTQNDGL